MVHNLVSFAVHEFPQVMPDCCCCCCHVSLGHHFAPHHLCEAPAVECAHLGLIQAMHLSPQLHLQQQRHAHTSLAHRHQHYKDCVQDGGPAGVLLIDWTAMAMSCGCSWRKKIKEGCRVHNTILRCYCCSPKARTLRILLHVLLTVLPPTRRYNASKRSSNATSCSVNLQSDTAHAMSVSGSRKASIVGRSG